MGNTMSPTSTEADHRRGVLNAKLPLLSKCPGFHHKDISLIGYLNPILPIQNSEEPIFVCVLAYRLLVDLRWRLQKLSECKNMWHEADAFLYDLERVERVQVRLGHQVKIWHLNLTGKSRRTLEMIGFKDMLKETVEVDFKL